MYSTDTYDKSMGIAILPKTPLSKWSAGLAVAAILFFALGGALFPFDPSDPRFNPVLALAVIIAVVGISGAALVTGLINMIKSKERSVFAFLSTAIGLWFLIATVVSLPQMYSYLSLYPTP
jgi:tellurite resistance protein TehA-like permease